MQARADERRRADRPRQGARRLLAGAAAVSVLAAAVSFGVVMGRSTAPAVVAAPAPSPSVPVIPVEQVPVVTSPGLRAGAAAVIAHTWGVEARFQGTGFTADEVYRAAFRARDGRLLPAGEFLAPAPRR